MGEMFVEVGMEPCWLRAYEITAHRSRHEKEFEIKIFLSERGPVVGVVSGACLRIESVRVMCNGEIPLPEDIV